MFGLAPQYQQFVPASPKTLEEAITLAKNYERGFDVANGTVMSVNNVSTMYANAPYTLVILAFASIGISFVAVTGGRKLTLS